MSVLFTSPANHPSPPPASDHSKAPRRGRLLATVAGVLAAFGSFVVLGVLAGAVGLAVVGLPLDLAPRDWNGLANGIAFGATVVSLLAYLFGGYVAARLAGSDGLQSGLRVFASGVLALAVLGLLLLVMSGPISVGTGLRQPTLAASGQGISVGDVATRAIIWSLIAMLLGSLAGGMLGVRAHARGADDDAQSPSRGSTSSR
jgi:MFS family permease